MTVVDFVHDETGSRPLNGRRKPPTDEDDIALFRADGDEPDPDPPEEDDEDEGVPVEPDDGPETEPVVEEPEEEDEEPPVSAKARRRHNQDEIDRLVREAEEAKARHEEMERRYYAEHRQRAEAELVAIKNHALNLTAQLDQAKREYTEAAELGESAKLGDVHLKINDLQHQLRQAQDFTRVREQELKQPGLTQPEPYPKHQPPPNPRAQLWAKRNKWFGDLSTPRNVGLTGAAYAIDAQLIREGLNPYTDQFYEELDRRLKTVGSAARPRQTVASVQTRAAPGVARPGRAVKLTAKQQVMAARLGVPLQEYAKYVEVR